MVGALSQITSWLEEHDWGILDNLGQHVHSGGKAMQACVYGGAFNFLKIDEFIEVVKAQACREPQNVQLLIQREEDERFHIHSVRAFFRSLALRTIGRFF